MSRTKGARNYTFVLEDELPEGFDIATGERRYAVIGNIVYMPPPPKGRRGFATHYDEESGEWQFTPLRRGHAPKGHRLERIAEVRKYRELILGEIPELINSRSLPRLIAQRLHQDKQRLGTSLKSLTEYVRNIIKDHPLPTSTSSPTA